MKRSGTLDKHVMPKQQSGCLSALKPSMITDADTGEILEDDSTVISFLKVVLKQTQVFSDKHRDKILEILEEPDNRVSAPVGTAWKGGLAFDYRLLDSSFLQRSRIGRVIIHRAMSDWTSFIENPKENKKEPTFTVLKAVLGAVDNQMASVDYDLAEKTITLNWACLDRNLIIKFDMPEFFTKYRISNISLPTVHERNGQAIFDFPFEESLFYHLCNPNNHMVCAGYDLGRVKPYVLTIVNRFGNRIALYEASSTLTALNRRRERKIAKKKELYKKRDSHAALRLDDVDEIQEEIDVLANEISGLGDEIAVMTGREIADYCSRHNVLCCFGEDLAEVNEWAGCSSKWVHGKQQEWIIRLCRRVGCAHMFVDAHNTSQLCAKCNSAVKHDDKKRLSICTNELCGCSDDRDRMASWVIAKRGLKAFVKYRKKVLNSMK